jgi:hypothetical protein
LLFTLIAGVFGWQERHRAHELTNQVASLTTAVQEKNALMQDRAALIDRLRQENDSYIKETALLREQGTARTPASPETEPSSSLSSADKDKVEFAAKTLDDPRAKEVIRQKQAVVFKQIYGDFVKENNLTEEQAQQFFGLLLDEDMRQFDEGTNFLSGSGNEPGLREAEAKEWATRKAELDAQLKALLGENGFAKWETYEKTTGERQVLIRMREQLALASTPLGEDQAQTLLRILMEERARSPSTLFVPGARNDPREDFRKLLAGNNAEQYDREERDFHQRVLSRTGALLDAEQYEALQNFQAQYLEVSKAGIEMMREAQTSKKK